MRQWRPILAEPAMPAQAAIAVCAPITHVVRDLDQVVHLHAVLDDRVAQRATVHRGVGADLDVVADERTADLRNLDPAVARLGDAETVAADHHARMQDAPRADAAARVDDDVRVQPRVLADRRRLRRPRSPDR